MFDARRSGDGALMHSASSYPASGGVQASRSSVAMLPSFVCTLLRSLYLRIRAYVNPNVALRPESEGSQHDGKFSSIR